MSETPLPAGMFLPLRFGRAVSFRLDAYSVMYWALYSFLVFNSMRWVRAPSLWENFLFWETL